MHERLNESAHAIRATARRSRYDLDCPFGFPGRLRMRGAGDDQQRDSDEP